jgi:hypothetical protein
LEVAGYGLYPQDDPGHGDAEHDRQSDGEKVAAAPASFLVAYR